MDYWQATFEIMTHVHQMAPLLYIINFSKLRFRVKDERTLISAKKSCRSEQYFRSYNLYNRVAPFFWPTLYNFYCLMLGFMNGNWW